MSIEKDLQALESTLDELENDSVDYESELSSDAEKLQADLDAQANEEQKAADAAAKGVEAHKNSISTLEHLKAPEKKTPAQKAAEAYKNHQATAAVAAAGPAIKPKPPKLSTELGQQKTQKEPPKFSITMAIAGAGDADTAAIQVDTKVQTDRFRFSLENFALDARYDGFNGQISITVYDAPYTDKVPEFNQLHDEFFKAYVQGGLLSFVLRASTREVDKGSKEKFYTPIMLTAMMDILGPRTYKEFVYDQKSKPVRAVNYTFKFYDPAQLMKNMWFSQVYLKKKPLELLDEKLKEFNENLAKDFADDNSKIKLIDIALDPEAKNCKKALEEPIEQLFLLLDSDDNKASFYEWFRHILTEAGANLFYDPFTNKYRIADDAKIDASKVAKEDQYDFFYGQHFSPGQYEFDVPMNTHAQEETLKVTTIKAEQVDNKPLPDMKPCKDDALGHRYIIKEPLINAALPETLTEAYNALETARQAAAERLPSLTLKTRFDLLKQTNIFKTAFTLVDPEKEKEHGHLSIAKKTYSTYGLRVTAHPIAPADNKVNSTTFGFEIELDLKELKDPYVPGYQPQTELGETYIQGWIVDGTKKAEGNTEELPETYKLEVDENKQVFYTVMVPDFDNKEPKYIQVKVPKHIESIFEDRPLEHDTAVNLLVSLGDNTVKISREKGYLNTKAMVGSIKPGQDTTKNVYVRGGQIGGKDTDYSYETTDVEKSGDLNTTIQSAHHKSGYNKVEINQAGNVSFRVYTKGKGTLGDPEKEVK